MKSSEEEEEEEEDPRLDSNSASRVMMQTLELERLEVFEGGKKREREREEGFFFLVRIKEN